MNWMRLEYVIAYTSNILELLRKTANNHKLLKESPERDLNPDFHYHKVELLRN